MHRSFDLIDQFPHKIENLKVKYEESWRTRTGLRPQLALWVVGRVRFDMENVKRVAFVGQMIDRPPQCGFAALGEIHGNANFLIFTHFLLYGNIIVKKIDVWFEISVLLFLFCFEVLD